MFYKNNETPLLKWFKCREDPQNVFVQWQTKFEKHIQTSQFSIDTIHERRKPNREFVLLIRMKKQNVKIIEK